MKNYKFGKSLQIAINFLHNFKENNSPVINNWKHFIWFDKIIPGVVRKIGENTSNASKFNVLEKEILFYGYRGTLLASVCLRGNEFTNSDESKPTFWQVTKIGYAQNYDESRTFAESEWIEKEIEEKDRVLR